MEKLYFIASPLFFSAFFIILVIVYFICYFFPKITREKEAGENVSVNGTYPVLSNFLIFFFIVQTFLIFFLVFYLDYLKRGLDFILLFLIMLIFSMGFLAFGLYAKSIEKAIMADELVKQNTEVNEAIKVLSLAFAIIVFYFRFKLLAELGI